MEISPVAKVSIVTKISEEILLTVVITETCKKLDIYALNFPILGDTMKKGSNYITY